MSPHLGLHASSAQDRSLVARADKAWNYIRDALVARGWGPLSTLAEAGVVTFLRKLQHGHMQIVTQTHVYAFPLAGHEQLEERPNSHPELRVRLTVVRDSFWVRVLTMSDLGFAEAYMYGDVDCDDLQSLFKIFMLNRAALSNLSGKLSYLVNLPQTLTSLRFMNTLSNSRANISAHYDISNKMFEGFLSSELMYSCAIFDDLDGDLNSLDRSVKINGHSRKLVSTTMSSDASDARPDELHDAQMRKIHHILKKAKITAGQRLLEIGSGWGELAIQAVNTAGCEVDTITLSVQQKALAEQRIEAAGLTHKIRVHLMDYRCMPADWEGAFDRFISIEMMEAIGPEFLTTYWKIVNWALKKTDAVGVVQVITLPEARYDQYLREVDFIKKWLVTRSRAEVHIQAAVFPGGSLPTLSVLVDSLHKASRGQFVIDSVQNIGPHYARTLREWCSRFLGHFGDIIAPALREEYPDVMDGPRGAQELEVFRRKWVYYYNYCEVGFATRTLGAHILTFTREGDAEYGCNVYA